VVANNFEGFRSAVAQDLLDRMKFVLTWSNFQLIQMVVSSAPTRKKWPRRVARGHKWSSHEQEARWEEGAKFVG
jgi:hypothetical protein